jgi:L,D-transpeptidase-like protein/putative peptidoglycan binding protein
MEEHQPKKISKPVAAVAALGLAMGLGWTLSSGFKSPPTSLVTSSNAVSIDWAYRGFCKELSIELDGRPVSLSDKDIQSGLAQAIVTVPTGRHEAVVTFHSLIPGLSREYPLTITVDQEPPKLTASLEKLPLNLVTTDDQITLSGQIELGADLYLENEPQTFGEDGRFQQAVTLKPGWNHLLVSAIDAAGNKSNVKLSLFRDTKDPEIAWQTKPDEVFDKNVARLEMDLSDDGEIVGVSGKVDQDQDVTWHAKGNGHWVGVTPELHEGFHHVSVKAVDKSGRVVTSERQVVINSSEALGEAVLGLGARGEDVRLLHQRLADAGFLANDAISDMFDKTTEMALEKLQEAEGFEVTGMAEGKTLAALGPRIFINLSNFSLVLDRPGKDQKRWMIASGSYDHPTPTGEYVIYEKVIDPTWLPPKSDWAKDAKPIPPGPSNPLGTRWLGFDWGGVGIHGTNAPWSIGSASSHGCMRMVTGQVEELFELVEVGTPVVVLGGWEEDPALKRYWPDKEIEEDGQDEEPEEVAKT